MPWLQGLHYRNRWFYDAQNKFKLGKDHDLRFRIAAQHIKPGESVLDLCSAFGQFKDYLPEGCRYQCVEASPDFVSILKRHKIPVLVHDLHTSMDMPDLKVNAAVMIVSLCQFRDTTAGEILESLKKIADRAIIVEDVLPKPRGEKVFLQKAMNYFCQTEYYRPIELFTADEFFGLMDRHGYTCRRINGRYLVGSFGSF
jgi:hypothetical protein